MCKKCLPSSKLSIFIRNLHISKANNFNLTSKEGEAIGEKSRLTKKRPSFGLVALGLHISQDTCEKTFVSPTSTRHPPSCSRNEILVFLNSNNLRPSILFLFSSRSKTHFLSILETIGSRACIATVGKKNYFLTTLPQFQGTRSTVDDTKSEAQLSRQHIKTMEELKTLKDENCKLRKKLETKVEVLDEINDKISTIATSLSIQLVFSVWITIAV